LSVPRWKRSLNRLDSSVRRLASGEGDEAFTLRLYEEMLGRAADPTGLFEGTRNLALGLVRRGRLRAYIASSDEYRAVSARRKGGIEYRLRHEPAPATDRSLATSAPKEIWLELTTRCNIVPACAMCGYATEGPARTRQDMDPATWRGLLPLLRQARRIGLHGAGEPLLYPYLDDLLGALATSPAVAGFNSNGHLLTAAASRRLVVRGLGWISISLDAATAGTYLRIRRRPDFDLLLSKIIGLKEIRNAGGSTRPQIEINMTLMKLNLPEAVAFVELAARLGIDRVMFQEIQPGGSQRVVAPDGFLFDYRDQELTGVSRRDEVLGRARERALSLGLEFSCELLYGSPAKADLPEDPEAPEAKEGPVASGPQPVCAEPWERLLFNVRGEAFVCCVQMVNEVLLGRANGDSVEQIWNGGRARFVREAMFDGPAPFFCRGCFRTFGQAGESPLLN
jgi:MoaA/NifB/PqqE/SkfB family radical SAM enzyme